MAAGSGDAVDGGVVDASEDVGVGSTVLEVLLTGERLGGAVEGLVDANAVALPAGMTEADGKGVWVADEFAGVGEEGFDCVDVKSAIREQIVTGVGVRGRHSGPTAGRAGM